VSEGADVHRLRPREFRDTVGVLARAFRDNPLNCAVIQSDDPDRRLRSNVVGTRTTLPMAAVHDAVWVVGVGGRVVGALIGTAPLGYPLPPPSVVARLRCLLGQGWVVARRWGEVFVQLDEIHPVEPHWYLGTLGIDPGHQGRGFGSALLRRWLEATRVEPAPVYLETDRRENVAFYAREGFEVERQTEVLGVPIWCMRRVVTPG
jgi:ribosomal protein S18 acetylase RimI-like enzyme